jgi:tRNA-specific 2-thiouridylase
MKKAIIAMSGGVDSAVASLLLKQQGYNLSGITMRLWADGENIPDSIECAPDDNALQARAVADALGFPHLTTALGESFKREVIERFINDYKNGKEKAIMALFGKCMKELKGNCDPQTLRKLLIDEINKA